MCFLFLVWVRPEHVANITSNHKPPSSSSSSSSLPPPPPSPLPPRLSCPPPPRRRPPRICPRPLTLFLLSILRLSPSHIQQPFSSVCSLNWLILVVSHHLKQVESVLSGCVRSNDMCSLFVFDCCHLCLPVWMTCALECRI